MKKNVDFILERMGIKNQIKLDDILRFKQNDKGTASVAAPGNKSNQSPPVKITFCGIIDKNVFLANLGKLKNTDFGDIKIGIDIPMCLLGAIHI